MENDDKYQMGMTSAHDLAKKRATQRGRVDAHNGKPRNSTALPGSAWDTWYNHGYDGGEHESSDL